MASKRTPASAVALGGVLAALAVVIMCLGTLIPVATYVCPVLCLLMAQMVLRSCGGRIAWGWYGAVAILSLLLAPDKEAALVFTFLGYYPLVKPWLDRRKGKRLWKGLLFNGSVLLIYGLLLKLLGLEEVAEEIRQTSRWLDIATLILGNVTFILIDRLLSGKGIRRKR